MSESRYAERVVAGDLRHEAACTWVGHPLPTRSRPTSTGIPVGELRDHQPDLGDVWGDQARDALAERTRREDITMGDGAAIFDAGRQFIGRDGRLLERRLFAAAFEGAPTGGALDALRGYRNADGGFGHGLEPDKLCPDSLAIDDQIALQVMDDAGAVDDALVAGVCDHLIAITRGGAVALADPVIERYPRAEHWAEWAYEPAVNPTAGLAGLLHKFGVDHGWRTAATAYCWDALEDGLPGDGHALGNVLEFLAHVDDRVRAAGVATDVPEHLASVSFLRLDPEDPAYGMTPLHYAPAPSSPWRTLFTDEVIAGHLDRMERDQLDDGGWPLTWEPPGSAATLAYRGMETLRCLRVLAAYGRIPT